MHPAKNGIAKYSQNKRKGAYMLQGYEGRIDSNGLVISIPEGYVSTHAVFETHYEDTNEYYIFFDGADITDSTKGVRVFQDSFPVTFRVFTQNDITVTSPNRQEITWAIEVVPV